MTVGIFLRHARVDAGLTQKQMAEKLKLKNGQAISNIERGLSPLPPKHLKKIARLVKVEPQDLLFMALKEQKQVYIARAGL